MRALLVVALLSGAAAADTVPPTDAGVPTDPNAPVATPPVDPNAPPPADPNAVPPPPPTPEPTPPPPPPPPPPPTPPPPPVTTTVTVTTPAPEPEKKREDDYYSRQRGMGIFHNGHLSLSVWQGDAPTVGTDPMTGTDTTVVGSSTIASFTFEGAWLGMPSSFGNFHGVEFGTGLRTGPWDFWMQLGTGVTFFNLGTGQPGSFRIGGGFGFGFNFAHGYGYVRGRAAMVIIPTKLDVEASVQWTPTSASTGYYDEQQWRLSAWYRPGKTETAYEFYVEKIVREDSSTMDEREFDGFGVGIGIAQ